MIIAFCTDLYIDVIAMAIITYYNSSDTLNQIMAYVYIKIILQRN